MKIKLFGLISLIIVLCSCRATSHPENDRSYLKASYHPDKAFNDYWYANKAEISSYNLQQARYGEMHNGHAVLIFVTEQIDPGTHIKAYGEKDIPILKMNATRDFLTGIYPYKVMNSVFTPVNITENANTLRNTFSMQEWCGHVYASLDYSADSYKCISHSYFPDEGDASTEMNVTTMEDELFNRVRIDATSLPTGTFQMIPALAFLRMRHVDIKPYRATAKLDKSVGYYEVNFPDLKRTTRIWYDTAFPHRITAWEETSPSGFGDNPALLTTRAELNKTMMLDYWDRHDNDDLYLRDSLGL